MMDGELLAILLQPHPVNNQLSCISEGRLAMVTSSGTDVVHASAQAALCQQVHLAVLAHFPTALQDSCKHHQCTYT